MTTKKTPPRVQSESEKKFPLQVRDFKRDVDESAGIQGKQSWRRSKGGPCWLWTNLPAA